MTTAAPPNQILYPVFAMFALTLAVLLRMRSLRFAAVRSAAVDVRFYRAFAEGVEPEPLRVVGRHFANLFEIPVLFYVGALMTYAAHQTTWWLVGCAWLFVALRCAHTAVHLGANDVRVRVTVYFAGNFVLVVFWATLLVQLVRAG
jgi:hypothetical protein